MGVCAPGPVFQGLWVTSPKRPRFAGGVPAADPSGWG
jgi:hypothetical protein